MQNVLGIINLVNEKQFLKELTNHRCIASVPFGGRYRLIDFTLSSFIHSNITQVAIFTKEKYRSLMDHIGSGKEWDLDRRAGGLFMFPPAHPDEKIKGDLQQFYDQLEFLQRSHANTVVISPGYHVYKIDFNDVIKYHRKNKADITVLYKKYVGNFVQKPIYHKCSVDLDSNVSDIELYTQPKPGENVCLETYILDKQLLIEIVKKCVENEEYDFIKDAVKANLQSVHVKGYEYTGEMPFIHSIESYHTSNMALLNEEIMRSFFYDKWDVYTKIKHEAPTNYGTSSHVSNSLIANGCDIQGIVENSIIFRGVKVRKGATVRNSIIMQKGEIEENSYVENIITDKQVKITRGKTIIGEYYPTVIKKAETV